MDTLKLFLDYRYEVTFNYSKHARDVPQIDVELEKLPPLLYEYDLRWEADRYAFSLKARNDHPLEDIFKHDNEVLQACKDILKPFQNADEAAHKKMRVTPHVDSLAEHCQAEPPHALLQPSEYRSEAKPDRPKAFFRVVQASVSTEASHRTKRTRF